MDVKTYTEDAKDVFKKYKIGCPFHLKAANTCDFNNNLCTLNNCLHFRSRYLDYTPICRIPGRQCCTVAFNGKEWKIGDCFKCEIAKRYENQE